MPGDGAVRLDDGTAGAVEGAPSVLSSGLAVLPAAQMTVCVGMTQPAATTEPGRCR